MPYKTFLNLFESNPMGVALKDSSSQVLEKLKSDIENPSFMEDIDEPVSMEIL